MAVALNSSSPSHLSKGSKISMGSSPRLSPSSDKRFWSSLRSRVDTILENRKRKNTSTEIGESEREERFKEDTLLLLQGFDSISSSLSQLTDNLDAAAQGASDLAQPSLTELLQREPKKSEDEEGIRPRVKRQCPSNESSEDDEAAIRNENKQSPTNVAKNEQMKKARNLAVSMATKAASLARELKSIKSDLCFMQDRCSLLEEENRRLRDGFSKGERPDEDDLVRLQLEALLAEKSRLANENANLTRENQCLHQLVEYHQLTSQDLSASYEQAIRGICLDFSSPIREYDNENDDYDDGYGDGVEIPHITGADSFEFSSSLDKHSEEQN
ncbi:uncharacterized protein LOC131226051 isoform X2 [Magnolia sinica]|nr:uncharacterized protein LOC131226051 isoform X2 [Magnolia sinica]